MFGVTSWEAKYFPPVPGEWVGNSECGFGKLADIGVPQSSCVTRSWLGCCVQPGWNECAERYMVSTFVRALKINPLSELSFAERK